jgi:hypothetical protein
MLTALFRLSSLLAAASAEYTHLQYVGFPIQTGYDAFISDGGLFYQDYGHSGVYPGLEIASTDISKRFELMSEALKTVAASSVIDLAPTTLKVFLMPEFFFRNAIGAYNMSDAGGKAAVEDLARSISSLLSGNEWRDWVGFFGTTIGFQTSHGSTSTGRGRGRRGASPSPLVDTYNFAMVRRGGANGEQFMHFKHYISSIDFLDATPGWEGTVTYPIMNVSLPPSSQPQPMGHTTKRYPILDGRARTDLEALAGRSVEGRFEIANVSFCLDICLDHAMGVCADALDAEKKAGTGPGLVSIHAIVSAGMKIEPKHVRVPPGGSAILADGLGAGAVQSVELHNPPMGAHVHKARSDEARAAVGDAAVEALARARGYAPNFVLNDDYPGHVSHTTIEVLGVRWKEKVDELYGVQRYGAPKPENPTPAEDGGSAADEAFTLEHEIQPLAFVFATTPIVKV